MNSSSKLSPLHTPYEGELLSRAHSDYPASVDYNTMGIGSQFEEYVSRALHSEPYEYHIKPSCLDDGDLVVFPAISQDGTLCEAQCFKKCKLSDKLYLSRKRRIQRLKKSSNLMDEVDQKEVRIIVSRVPDENRRNYRKSSHHSAIIARAKEMLLAI
ncbi:hypothetical protein F4803DRAFT_563162 [Xylaria telfairii]|nr:hypothetical protein F4803DRAFT_563162 [Xylaria telfairii]